VKFVVASDYIAHIYCGRQDTKGAGS